MAYYLLTVLIYAFQMNWCSMVLNDCTCMPLHPQQAFCNSDIVIRCTVLQDFWKTKQSTILNKSSAGSIQARYKIQLTAIWKGRKFIRTTMQQSNRSSSRRKTDAIVYTNGPCALSSLEIGKKYILTGNIVSNKIYMTACHWRIEFNSKAKRIRREFRKGNFHCWCIVESCFRDVICKRNRRYSCAWSVSLDTKQCEFRSCRYRNGECRWTENPDMNTCENVRRVYRLKSPGYF